MSEESGGMYVVAGLVVWAGVCCVVGAVWWLVG